LAPTFIIIEPPLGGTFIVAGGTTDNSIGLEVS
jgi:hypothetical protein